MRGPLLVCAAALVGCGDPASYLVVTVQNRPAVHGATSLRITLSNEGTMRTDELSLGGAQFPVTFSLSAPGRSGELDIQVEAVDEGGLLVGRGVATTSLDATVASVMLDTADFVVNTDFADDQYPSNDFEAHGFQIAATSSGTFTVAFRDGCLSPCNMFGRMFEPSGRPVSTQIAAGTNAFPLSTELTSSISTPAVAAAGATTVAMWDFRHTVGMTTTSGIACRTLDAMGRANANEVEVSNDATTDVVAIAPMSNSNFAVIWTAIITNTVVRAAIVRPDCTPLAAPVTVSTTALPRRPAVASTGTPPTVLYAWVVSGSVYVRLGSATNALQGAADVQFLPKTATEEVEFVRVAPLGTGFAVLARWVDSLNFTGPGRIEMYRTNATGAVLGPPVVVTTRSGSDFGSSEGFSAATRADGTLMVAWHACEANGDGLGCGVFGRAFDAGGTPLGEELTIPTTTLADQTNPSVTALPDAFAVTWRDDSMQAPDIAGSAVRARIVYPEASTGAN